MRKKIKKTEYQRDTKTIQKDELNKLNDFLSQKKVIVLIGVIFCIITTLICNYLITTSINVVTQTQFTDGHINSVSNMFALVNMFKFQFKYFPIYIILYIGDLMFYMIFLYKSRVSWQNLNVGQRGHARITTNEEIRQQYRSVPLTKEEYTGRHGYTVRMEGGKAYIDDTSTNILTLGMTRSGKGECMVFPTIDIFSRVKELQSERIKCKPSMIITDPKRELFAFSKETLEKRGYKVLKLDLLEPRKSIGFNVLESVTSKYKSGDNDLMEEVARAFVTSLYTTSEGSDDEKSGFFKELAISGLTALILAHTQDCVDAGSEECNNLCSIYKNFMHLQSERSHYDEEKIMLDDYFSKRPKFDRAKELYGELINQPPQTKNNILANISRKLSLYGGESIARMTSYSSVTAHQLGFGEDPIAVFISAPESNEAYYGIFTTFFQQISTDLSILATKNGGQVDRPVEFLFDEFANIPPIPRIANNMTICLGKNIRFIFVIQSYAQIQKLYGDHDASTIIENCATEIYFLSKNQDTLKLFSEGLGSKTIVDISRTGTKLSLNKSQTETQIEQELVSPSELRELAPGENIIQRSIYRKDLKGNDIIPFPIVNKGKNRMRHRFEYMLDDFPNRNITDVDDQYSNQDIKLSEIIFDCENQIYSNKQNKNIKKRNIEPLSSLDIEQTIKELAAILDEEDDKIKEIIGSDIAGLNVLIQKKYSDKEISIQGKIEAMKIIKKISTK